MKCQMSRVDPILIADELIDEKESQYDEGVEKDLENEIIFGPERDLQAALRSNIEQLEAGLNIIDEGTERSTQAGRASSDVIAQVLSYMSAVAESENNPVRGMIVAGDFSERVILAARAVPSLSPVKYSFRFSFKRIE